LFSGELTAVASADLGGLGPTQGLPARQNWAWPSILPLLLPWLAVLGLLGLPSNRDLRAWIIWLPAAGLAAIGGGLTALIGEGGQTSSLIQLAYPVPFGLATVWLLAGALAKRRHRTLSAAILSLITSTSFILAFFSLLTSCLSRS
jgi:hypothetical protein